MSQPVHMRKGVNYSGNSFSATYADSVIGTILAYGGSTAPYGWFLCQGQALSRTEYHELFEVIGTTFGSGDGSTTFNIPDLRSESIGSVGNFIIKAKYSASPAGDVLGVQDIRDTLGETPIPSELGTTVTGAINTLGNRFNYSFTEKVVGKWHDGKDLYGRLIDCGTIPSQAAANRQMTSITGIDHCHLQFAYTYNSSTKLEMTLPYLPYGGGTLDSAMMETHIIREASSPTVANIILNTGMDRSAFGKLFVYAEYTKSTT